jgi:hypothetical protein
MFRRKTLMNKAAKRVAACATSMGRLAKRSAPFLICITIAAIPLLAQSGSGDISGSTSQLTTLGLSILKVFLALAGISFVGLLIWGGLTLATNRPRGLAMVAGGLVGALLAGLSFTLVNTLTGQSVSATGMLLLHF